MHEEENGGYLSCTSEDEHYYVSFRDKGDVPFIWLNCKEASYGNGDSFDSTDISKMTLNGEALKKKELELAEPPVNGAPCRGGSTENGRRTDVMHWCCSMREQQEESHSRLTGPQSGEKSRPVSSMWISSMQTAGN